MQKTPVNKAAQDQFVKNQKDNMVKDITQKESKIPKNPSIFKENENNPIVKKTFFK